MLNELELTKQLRLGFPNGAEQNGSAIATTRKFVEDVVAVIAAAYHDASIDILLKFERDETETDIRGFVTYVEPITNSVPMVISPWLVRIENDQVWVAQPNSAAELFWMLLPHIQKTIASAQAAA